MAALLRDLEMVVPDAQGICFGADPTDQAPDEALPPPPIEELAIVPPAIPSSADWVSEAAPFGAMWNDQCGDCTVAAVGHLFQCWSSAVGQRDVPSDQDVLAVYEATTPWRPGGPKDIGLGYGNCLRQCQTAGMGGRRVSHYVQSSAKGSRIVDAIKSAVEVYGGALVMLELPDAAVPRDAAHIPQWSGDMGVPDQKALHSIPVLAYDDNRCRMVTWGVQWDMDWDFATRYVIQVWAATSDRWISPASGESPTGLTLGQLEAHLQAWAA